MHNSRLAGHYSREIRFEESVTGEPPVTSFARQSVLTQENLKDKELFEKLKQSELERGRDEHEATEIAAKTVKEQRRRESRSKDEDLRCVPPEAVPWPI